MDKLSIAEAWNKIKEVWKQNFGDMPMPMEGTTTPYLMKDGSKMKCAGTMKVGCAVNIEGANGEEFTAPDGEHEMASGHVVSVADGKICDIKNGAGDPGENMEMEAIKKEYDEKFAALDQRFTAQADELKTLKEAADKTKLDFEAQTKTLTETQEALKKLEDAASAQSVTKKYEFTSAANDKGEKKTPTELMLEAFGPITINKKLEE